MCVMYEAKVIWQRDCCAYRAQTPHFMYRSIPLGVFNRHQPYRIFKRFIVNYDDKWINSSKLAVGKKSALQNFQSHTKSESQVILTIFMLIVYTLEDFQLALSIQFIHRVTFSIAPNKGRCGKLISISLNVHAF